MILHLLPEIIPFSAKKTNQYQNSYAIPGIHSGTAIPSLRWQFNSRKSNTQFRGWNIYPVLPIPG
jgi:hypothetical protein